MEIKYCIIEGKRLYSLKDSQSVGCNDLQDFCELQKYVKIKVNFNISALVLLNIRGNERRFLWLVYFYPLSENAFCP